MVTKIVKCCESGKIIVGCLENEKMKWEVMRNKGKLKGEKIFIENDLSWEERRIQERINRWCREEREKDRDVKIGTGRVKIDGIWRRWEEIEGREKGQEVQSEKGEERVMEGNNQNFS